MGMGHYCVIIGCPGVYHVNRNSCVFAGCSEDYFDENGSYFIVGRQVPDTESKQLGLDDKLGKGEVIIQVPKALIDHVKPGRHYKIISRKHNLGDI